MILLVFDLEVCTARFTVHGQNNRKLGVFCKFLTTCRALLADLYGETEYLWQSDKSPTHFLLWSCFITYHKMNRHNEKRAQMGGGVWNVPLADGDRAKAEFVISDSWGNLIWMSLFLTERCDQIFPDQLGSQCAVGSWRMWYTRRGTNCSQCTTSRVIVRGKSRLRLSRKGAGAGWWRKPCFPVGDLRGEGRCELDRAWGYYSNWHFTSHACTWSPGANQRVGFAVEGEWKAGTGAAGECIRGVIALLIFVCPCVTPPDAHSPNTHTRAHTAH